MAKGVRWKGPINWTAIYRAFQNKVAGAANELGWASKLQAVLSIIHFSSVEDYLEFFSSFNKMFLLNKDLADPARRTF